MSLSAQPSAIIKNLSPPRTGNGSEQKITQLINELHLEKERIRVSSRKRAAQFLKDRRQKAQRYSKVVSRRVKSQVNREAADLYKQIVQKSHQDCLLLAVKVVESVIKSELSKQQNKILSNRLRDALSQLDPTLNVSAITINPADLKRQESILDELCKNFHLKLTTNIDLPEGEVELTSNNGKLYLNWQQELKDLAQVILRNFRKRVEGVK